MSVPALHFEAKKHAIRQTADGWVVSFVVHPNDISPEFAVSALGSRYMVALAQIGEDEQPVSACAPQRERPAVLHSSPRAGGGATSTKTPAERAVQRAGMLPHDERFRAWVHQSRCLPFDEAVTEADAAEFIRLECCGGNSRKLIAEAPEYMDRFMEMLTAFQIDVGELPEPR